ncbi:hypothetical protein Val02_85550 [Virgisporangium aliadipatigenens]|uniref:Insecticide toxin TcdB middle/N-terminal domain-containing protein n=1 Tax=Virgisporangium aliadipatigenens TaxID=741659 RepID=A0A8J4DVC8_9ACTN|nr:SpvB/TcaC N-terminal domain-containing protein [Virgisporangium aliadipatigenens]GIJ51669.1 hypothetical protein Val02_85550 [Virgisporangium aliadipatigenens]
MTGISTPRGGGALSGIGETFQPGLHTGTGTLKVPLPLPPGRGTVAPSLSLTYSSAAGNGPWGLGWTLDVPRIARRTDREVPRYVDTDVFVLSGAEELVPVPLGPAVEHPVPDGAMAARYRPGTELAYARILHVTGPGNDYWDVWTGDGLRNRYGTARPPDVPPGWVDPATVRTPAGEIFAWLLSGTTDSLGNRIAYTYRGDSGAQRYLSTVAYADHGDPANPEFVVTVSVLYQDRPDPFSERRPGFELRTTLRAERIEITTAGVSTVVELKYAAGDLSQLASVRVVGHDAVTGDRQALPPLTFDYRAWQPTERRYLPLSGTLPPRPLGSGTELVDLFGDALPSVVELETGRYWRNRGDGSFDLPRTLRSAPAGARFGAPGVLLTDFNADGRPEVAVTVAGRTTVWPVAAPADGEPAGFAPPGRAVAAPAAGYGVAQIRLADLDGDRVPDLLFGGATPLVATGDGHGGYDRPRPLRDPPPVLADLSRPQVHLTDMTGDGLTDLVEVRDGTVRYWPGLGRQRFGPMVTMTGPPRLPAGYDPRRLLLGDVTGDGAADALYVGDGSVTVWLNRCGNGFAPPVEIRGTPQVDGRAVVRLADLFGTGIGGLLWSGLGARGGWAFLDLTGGVKPYLLTRVDNHCGASTELTWTTSTAHAVRDRTAGRPWRTTLPFPVHVLAAARSVDWFSGTVLRSGFDYHDGLWDPGRREFRGFGRVERRDLPGTLDAPATATAVEELDPLVLPASLPADFDAAAHGNLLANWSFDERGPGPVVLTTTPDRPHDEIASAAPGWRASNATAATTRTALVPSALPQGRGGSMVRVATDGEGCGLVQAVPGRAAVEVSAWVRVIRGTVRLDVGGQAAVALDRTGRWHLLRGAGDGAVSLLAGAGGAEFEVDHTWARRPDLPADPGESPPTRTVTWFHLGAAAEYGPDDFWPGDPPLTAPVDRSQLPSTLPQAVRDTALRATRGRVVRTELYAEDMPDRPYEVHDIALQVVPVLDGRELDDASWRGSPVFTVREMLSRGAMWDRGTEPMHRLTATGGYDEYGRPTVAVEAGVPRGRDPRSPGSPCLATVIRTGYATRDDAVLYRLDRVSRRARHEAVDPGTGAVTAFAATPVEGELLDLRLTYYDGSAFTGLGLGELGEHALPTRSEQLVLTPERLAHVTGADPAPPYLALHGAAPPAVWPAEYPDAFRDLVTGAPSARGARLGYVWHDGDAEVPAGYYTADSRLEYDVHAPVAGRPPRGMVRVSRDPFGGDIRTEYDDRQLLPVAVVDPVGLRTEAVYDQRVLKPAIVIDPNGNRTTAGYTPLGLTAWISHTGPPGAAAGDLPGRPGQVFHYDLTAWDDAREPLGVTTVRRVEHAWTLIAAEEARRENAGEPPITPADIDAMFGPDEATDHPERFLQVVDFTDGFGRPLQTRTQAGDLAVTDNGLSSAPGAAERIIVADPPVPDAVVVSGWQRYDHHGRPIVVYEPFSDSGWRYLPPAADRLAGLAAERQHFDARGRKTVTVAADGSRTRLVYGIPADPAEPWAAAPSPWEVWAYDAEDEAGRTHATLSPSTAGHWDTPGSIELDALGRTVRDIRRGPTEKSVTTFSYDASGNLVAVTDPLGRIAATTVHDLAGRPWTRWRIDSGGTRTVLDPAGGAVEDRDAKGAIVLTGFDAAHRAVRRWAADHPDERPTLREVTEYGTDTAEPGSRGRVVVAYDEAGRVTTEGHDLDGNPLRAVRRLLRADIDSPVDWEPLDQAAALLADEVYEMDARYDALGRRSELVAPRDVTGSRAVIEFAYDRGGGITRVTVDGVAHLRDIAYDAHGRRSVALLGNGVLLRFGYDPRTRRLRRLRAESVTTEAGTWTCDGPVLQDLTHRYDLNGNLVVLADRTPGCGVPPGDLDALDRVFDYDAFDRLVAADGRETDTVPAPPWLDVPRGDDVTRTRRYQETYRYDDAGNLIELRHAATGGGYTRVFATGDGNRLASLTDGGTTIPYRHDDCGNLLAEADNRFLEWDYADRLVAFRDQTEDAEPTVSARYRYDGTGKRVVKVVRRSSGPDLVTVYVGPFERLVRGDTVVDEIRLTDAGAALATIRRGDALPDDPMSAHPVTYQLGDHLSSVAATLSGDGTLLAREEYLPYGETAFGSYRRKRYRYTATERDEESGFAYHDARYYAPWLGRWTAVDPAPRTDGTGAYNYAAGNPLRLVDRDGRQEKPAQPGPDTANVKPRGDIRVNAAVGAEQATRQQALITSKGTNVVAREVPIPEGRLDAVTSRLGRGLRALEQKSLTAWKKGGHYVDELGKLRSENVDAMIRKAVEQVQRHMKGLEKLRVENPDLVLPTRENILITVRGPKAVVAGVMARAKVIAAETGIGIGVIAEPPRIKAPRGFASVPGVVATPLLIYGIYSTGSNMVAAYEEGQRTGSSLPVVEQAARETGGWVGGFVGGFMLGAALGIETGPGALVTGLIGGFVGGTAGYMGADIGIDQLHKTADALRQGIETFVLPVPGPRIGPWGGW